MRYIKPFLAGEKIKKIPVQSIVSWGRNDRGYTAIYITLRPKPFLATASADEIAQEMHGGYQHGR